MSINRCALAALQTMVVSHGKTFQKSVIGAQGNVLLDAKGCGRIMGLSQPMRLAVGVQDLDLPSLFASMEAARAELGVDEYSISQTTLEHVFVALAEIGTQQDSTNAMQ